MFRPVARAAIRAASNGKSVAAARRVPARRWASTATDKPRSWKSGAARWGLAAAIVYYYNTTNVFAEEASDQHTHYPPPATSDTEALPTLESYAKKPAPVPALSNTQTSSTPIAAEGESTPIPSADAGDLEAEASQQGAFNEETGEINWDCPCLGGMAHGPCGDEFKAAFSCFVYSKEEPKGVDCIDKFKGMQDCFRAHPDIYGAELEDDEEGLDGGLPEDEAGQPPALVRDAGSLETAGSVDDTAAPITDDVKEKVSKVKDDIKGKAIEATDDIKERATAAKDEIKERAAAAKEQAQEKKSEIEEGDTLIPKAAHHATDAKAETKSKA